MSIVLNEFVGFDPKKPTNLSQSTGFKEWMEKCTNFQESDEHHKVSENKPFYTATIEAIHPDIPTRNNTRYKLSSFTEQNLATWTSPYNCPLILYHNDYDGQKVGTITNAAMANSERCAGSKTLVLTASVPDWKDQERVSQGIYNTVSIGVSAKDVRCSICGKQISNGEWCEHERGEVYKNEATGQKETCYWDVYDWEAKEISFVHVPSDKYAGVISYSYHLPDNMPSLKTDNPSYISLVSSESQERNTNIVQIDESAQKNAVQKPKEKTEYKGENTLEIKEAEKRISSLETAQKALEGDKKNLMEKVDSLNKDKISLQESVAALKKESEKKDLAVSQEKELREAAEKKIVALEKEVKLSLAESLSTLREKAGKVAIQKLEERSIESLRDAIADLKADLAEKAKLEEAAESKEAEDKLHDEKGAVKPAQLKEAQETPVEEPHKSADNNIVIENFDL